MSEILPEERVSAAFETPEFSNRFEFITSEEFKLNTERLAEDTRIEIQDNVQRVSRQAFEGVVDSIAEEEKWSEKVDFEQIAEAMNAPGFEKVAALPMEGPVKTLNDGMIAKSKQFMKSISSKFSEFKDEFAKLEQSGKDFMEAVDKKSIGEQQQFLRDFPVQVDDVTNKMLNTPEGQALLAEKYKLSRTILKGVIGLAILAGAVASIYLASKAWAEAQSGCYYYNGIQSSSGPLACPRVEHDCQCGDLTKSQEDNCKASPNLPFCCNGAYKACTKTRSDSSSVWYVWEKKSPFAPINGFGNGINNLIDALEQSAETFFKFFAFILKYLPWLVGIGIVLYLASLFVHK